MINNPELIEKIKQQIRNTTKEQLEIAIRKTEEEFTDIIEYSEGIEQYKEEIYLIGNYDCFYIHKNSTRGFLSKLLINIQKKKTKEKKQNLELEAA